MAVETRHTLPGWRDGAVVRRLLSVDHKDIGVLYLGFAATLLAAAGVARLLFFIDFAHAPGTLLSDFGTLQVFSLQATALMFGFGLPFVLGLATYVVPLQIGARTLAWPGLNAVSFWLYVAGTMTMMAGFGAGDPGTDSPAVPLSPAGQQLWVLGLLLVGIAAVGCSLSLLQTVRARRAPGMTWGRLPLFSLASAGFALALLVGMTISAVAAGIFLIDDGAARGFFAYDAADEGFAFYQQPAWFAGHVLAFALLVPALGMVSEAMTALGARAAGARKLASLGIVAATLLALLVGVYHVLADPFGSTFANGIPLAGFIVLGAIAPCTLAWVSQLRAIGRAPQPIVVLVLGLLVLLDVGTVLGFAMGFPGSYKADTTSFHLIAHFDGTLAGAAMLAFAAGLLYWFPKVTGREFDARFARAAAGLLALGAVGVMVGQHVAAEGDLGAWSVGAKVGGSLALGGYLLMFLGGIHLVGGALLSRRVGARVGNDPWHADTLEWYVASPPPPANFGRVPDVQSERPLADIRARLGAGDD